MFPAYTLTFVIKIKGNKGDFLKVFKLLSSWSRSQQPVLRTVNSDSLTVARRWQSEHGAHTLQYKAEHLWVDGPTPSSTTLVSGSTYSGESGSHTPETPLQRFTPLQVSEAALSSNRHSDTFYHFKGTWKQQPSPLHHHVSFRCRADPRPMFAGLPLQGAVTVKIKFNWTKRQQGVS